MAQPPQEPMAQLHALLHGLPPDDERRLTCFQCIGRVAVAIRLSET